GAVVGALVIDDMFAILKQTWIVPMTFAALFWVGMYWRRATTTAGWVTVIFCVMSFFVLPRIIPAISPDLRSNETFLKVTEVVETKTERKASPSDVAAGKSEVVGETITEVKKTGGKSLYWSNGVKTDVGVARGEGTFRFDMIIYDKILGFDLTKVRNATLSTLDLPFKIIAPFFVMILVSLFTQPNSKKALDRLYVKMKTPVDPDPERDEAEIDVSYARPDRFDDRKLFPGTQLEFQRPTKMDFWGFIGCFAICFAIIGIVLWVSKIGA
ncbi:MAG: hypothetical protein VYD34_01925, partial [Verrucomicrobiota bacterium]|nr:hypothetical protein [Verrucomicrobiota bacterium]